MKNDDETVCMNVEIRLTKGLFHGCFHPPPPSPFPWSQLFCLCLERSCLKETSLILLIYYRSYWNREIKGISTTPPLKYPLWINEYTQYLILYTRAFKVSWILGWENGMAEQTWQNQKQYKFYCFTLRIWKLFFSSFQPLNYERELTHFP